MLRKNCLIAMLAAVVLAAAPLASFGQGRGAALADQPMPAPMLAQAGNPVNTALASYTDLLSKNADGVAALAADTLTADNIVSWQMPHGGFYKLPANYGARWDGSTARSGWFGAGKVELGTIDNDATVTEILVLANLYGRSGNLAYRDSARRALDFLLNMQYPSGGFPQVYPARTGTVYSNYVTFNDDAMVRVLILLDHAARQKAPLDGDLFTARQRARLTPAIDLAVDFIVKAQIVQHGVKTVWCAQHDPVNYAPLGGRAYELASKSGKESVLILAFLMSRPQTAAVAAAAKAGIAWFKSSAVQRKDTAYKRTQATDTSPFVSEAGSTVWYRFYDLAADTGFFSGRLPTDQPPGKGKQYDIMLVEPERRYGYQWGGNYGDALFEYSDAVGY